MRIRVNVPNFSLRHAVEAGKSSVDLRLALAEGEGESELFVAV